MKGRKLNYRFHNPNTEEATADYILKLFIEANKNKLERAIAAAASDAAAGLGNCKSNSIQN